MVLVLIGVLQEAMLIVVLMLENAGAQAKGAMILANKTKSLKIKHYS